MAAVMLALSGVACRSDGDGSIDGRSPATQPATMPTPDAIDADHVDIGTAVYVGDQMLRGYDPTPELVVDEHTVDRSKFPNVDVHCHWSIEEDPKAMLEAMDRRNIYAAVDLSGGYGDELDAMVDRFVRASPERLIVFLNLPFNDIDREGFADWAVAEIERAHEMGVKGLKVFKSLGVYHRDSSGELVKIDDRRLDPIWAKCGELGMPVLIHTADPVAFWRPTDEKNERWMQLTRRPTWSFYGTDVPPRDELIAARDRVLERHRETTFIGAHVANNAEDLKRVAADLEKHSNLVLDISGRVAELGRQPYSTRAFILKYPDRVLFGTDRFPGRTSQPRYEIYFRFLETSDQYFKYYDHDFPPAGDWRIYGIDLPDPVLRAVYYDNAARVLGLPKLERAERVLSSVSDAEASSHEAER